MMALQTLRVTAQFHTRNGLDDAALLDYFRDHTSATLSWFGRYGPRKDVDGSEHRPERRTSTAGQKQRSPNKSGGVRLPSNSRHDDRSRGAQLGAHGTQREFSARAGASPTLTLSANDSSRVGGPPTSCLIGAENFQRHDLGSEAHYAENGVVGPPHPVECRNAVGNGAESATASRSRDRAATCRARRRYFCFTRRLGEG